MTVWIDKFDAQRKSARHGIRLVEEVYPALGDRCADVLDEVEAAFDRVLDDPSRIGTEAGHIRMLLEGLQADAKALDQASTSHGT